MGNNCIGYFIEQFRYLGEYLREIVLREIVDLPNFSRIWMGFLSGSGDRDHYCGTSVVRGAAAALSGGGLPKDQTTNQTHNHPTLLPQGLLIWGSRCHQRDRLSRHSLNTFVNVVLA